MKVKVARQLRLMQARHPLVMNMTNFVVMNNTANALLAIGASPMMIHAKKEVEQAVKTADSLVVNVGTLDEYWAESMILATKTAKDTNTPWVLDPVGAGLSDFRNEVIRELIANEPTVIRGNASEIFALHTFSESATKGVDSTMNSWQVLETAQKIHQRTQSVICISGATDYIVGEKIVEVNNGHPMMTKVTGLGCSATAIIGAFIANKNDPFLEAVSGVAIFSLSGEYAANKSLGPGTLQVQLLDRLSKISETNIVHHSKIHFLRNFPT